MKTKNTDQINEALIILMEECAEVIKIASKSWRFGLNDFHPKKKKNNRSLLAEECGHVVAMIDVLIDMGIVSIINVTEGIGGKREKLNKWSNLFVPVLTKALIPIVEKK